VTFDRTWVLALAWIPLAWMFWEWRRTTRRGALVLKAASFTAILLALAEPRLSTEETKIAAMVLVDTSASTSEADLANASRLASAINASKGRHYVRVIPFARNTRALDHAELTPALHLRATPGDAGRATDLEGAVREAIASAPAGMVPRLVLISDGKENKGSIARAAWQAQQLGIPIDTFALAGRTRPALRLESASLPVSAFTGEQFPIDLLVSAPQAANAQVELTADGRTLGQSEIRLDAGQNPVRLHASLNAPGALEVAVAIRSAGQGEVRFDQAIMLRRPKVLYISEDPANLDNHLTATLTAGQFDVQRVSAISSNLDWGDYQLVIFNNWDLDSVPNASKDALERYVKQGGGLLVIGGERNIYKDLKKGEDALNRTLPATVAPPRSPEGTAVVLIVDKSSSMEGRKMELARLAAIGVVENLRPIDLVGVLIFDNTFEWAVPIRRAEDRTLIKRLISGITPDGGTQIPPALAEAYKKILPVQASYKHIVLLTDGISEEGDSLDLAKEALAKRVTISSVGLGQDVNRSYLEKIAVNAGGKAYFLTDPSGLEQILLKDVQEHTGSTAVERALGPEVGKQAEILDGVGIESAPALKGYIRFTAKPGADTILRIDRRDPLLVRWQYGLGRSAVFASDAKPRWAADWLAWKGFDKFWTNLCRDLLPHSQMGEAAVEYDSASGDLVVDYRLGQGAEEPAQVPAIFVFGPDGFQQPIEVKKIAAGTFRGRVPAGARQGLFRVRPLEESRVFPETGLYRPEAELADFGSNEPLLRQVASFTGGRFQPRPEDVFEAGRRSTPTVISLWPALLGLAVILSLAELVLRKWKGVMAGRAVAA
jgi:Ca-activated chloride channel family protein